MDKSLVLLILSCVLFGSCENQPTQTKGINDNALKERFNLSTNVKNIDDDLKDINHKAVTKYRGDTLSIEIYVKDDDYSSKYYTDLLIELIICEISEDIIPKYKIEIVRCFENGTRSRPEVISNDMIYKILSVNKIKIYYDFKKYLVKNITGEKMVKFNAIIDHLMKSKEVTNLSHLKENDFIMVVMAYATQYCLPTKKNNFYRKVLLAIKETAEDKELWPDFNPQDIDYFLNYCDSVHGTDSNKKENRTYFN